MELGAFSVSLAVKDLEISRQFYRKLGFQETGGSEQERYLILKNGACIIGIFEGMFDQNILTFNPGLAQDTTRLERYTDVRDLQRELKERGVTLTGEAAPESEGPAHITLTDPDGNRILIDQFF